MKLKTQTLAMVEEHVNRRSPTDNARGTQTWRLIENSDRQGNVNVTDN